VRTRDEVRRAIHAALEPLPFVHAAWEGGSTAFGRDDQFSDLDLHVLVDDDFVERAFAAVEDSLLSLGGISLHYRVPEPSWHGHSQAFYRLVEGAPHLLVDVVVMRCSSEGRFLGRERHGEPVVLFDKIGQIRAEPVDREELREIVEHRLRRIHTLVPMFADFVEKELHRDNELGALANYHGFVLRPLVELLGIRYCPERSDYGVRHVVGDLPPEAVERLEHLWFVPDAAGVLERCRDALEWVGEILDDIEAEGIDL
jgi:hypothetical protein